ncbi:MAG: hypothetical protein MR748_03040, partial [Clostridiales bacterium]|nr:hypothetical protein [Clostridiales bacterium]
SISAVLLYTLSRTSDSPPVCFLVNDTLSVCESFVFLFVITPTFIIEPEKFTVAQWAQPPQAVSDPQVCHETSRDYGSRPCDD